MPFDVGDSVPLAWDVADEDGNPVDAGTVTLTVTLPDGSDSNPNVPAPAVTGEYRVTYVPATPGRYAWRAVTTVPATSFADVFEVRELVSPSMISLADAKRSLNIPASTTTFDDELREYTEAVTRVVEDFVGPIVVRSYTRRLWGYDYCVRLPHTQVREITAITLVADGSSPVTISDLTIDSLTGIVRYKDNVSQFPYGELEFTYTVGRDVTQPSWTLAAKLILQSNWRSQLGNLPAVQGDEDHLISSNQSVPFYMPAQALALLSYDNTSTGFA
jgi:hypothetical protein